MTAGIGAVVEAEVQTAMVRAQRGPPPWSAAERVEAADSAVLAVEVDGLYVQRGATRAGTRCTR